MIMNLKRMKCIVSHNTDIYYKYTRTPINCYHFIFGVSLEVSIRDRLRSNTFRWSRKFSKIWWIWKRWAWLISYWPKCPLYFRLDESLINYYSRSGDAYTLTISQTKFYLLRFKLAEVCVHLVIHFGEAISILIIGTIKYQISWVYID